MNFDKVEKIPLPRWERVGVRVIPLPFIPSRKGRGNGTFYEFVNFAIAHSVT